MNLQRWITPEQYLEIERAGEFRHEYYNGRMYLMPGGSFRHAVIISHLSRELGNILRERPCSVATSDLRLSIATDGLYTYPDVVVVCGAPKFLDGRADTLLNPALIVEVPSPSTEAYDRGFKSAQYRNIESLQEYALVSQNEARVEIFQRRDTGHWLLAEFVGLEAAARFESVDASIPLAEIYDKISFDSGSRSVANEPSAIMARLVPKTNPYIRQINSLSLFSRWSGAGKCEAEDSCGC